MDNENPTPISPLTPPEVPTPPTSTSITPTPTPPVSTPVTSAPMPPVSTPIASTSTPPVSTPVVATQLTASSSIDQRDKVFAALSYVSFLFIIPLIGRRKDSEVMFNAKQGMVLFIAEVIIWFVLFILELILTGRFSGLGTTIFYGIAVIFWIVPLVFSLMGISYVFKGKHWLMPIIGKISQKIQL